MDGSMFCPQCGTYNPDDAAACQNCGMLQNIMNDPDGKARHVSGKDKKTGSLAMSFAGLGIGILSFWPYPYLASRVYYPILHQGPFLHCAFDLGCLGGIPLGLIGIILSVLAVRKMLKDFWVVIIAVLGILLSIGGIAGHVWFIVTCQFCQ